MDMDAIKQSFGKSTPNIKEVVGRDFLIKDSDAAFMLGCSKATFWRRVADGTFPRPIKIGGTSRWRFRDIDDVINEASKERDSEEIRCAECDCENGGSDCNLIKSGTGASAPGMLLDSFSKVDLRQEGQVYVNGRPCGPSD
jgi:predicted DNA-binding transcriptional regulator AlpA